jgi:hypothetical protein
MAILPIASTAQIFDADSTKNNPQPTENLGNDEKLLDRFFFGGNLGAQFGTLTMVHVAPLVGFKVTERLNVGTRIQYQYLRFNGIGAFDSHVFGGSLFSRYFVFNNFFAHAEYEVINGFFAPANGERVTIPHLFVGGGYLFRFNDNVGLAVTAMYELLQRTYSPYRNPIIGAGITYGL